LTTLCAAGVTDCTYNQYIHPDSLTLRISGSEALSVTSTHRNLVHHATPDQLESGRPNPPFAEDVEQHLQQNETMQQEENDSEYRSKGIQNGDYSPVLHTQASPCSSSSDNHSDDQFPTYDSEGEDELSEGDSSDSGHASRRIPMPKDDQNPMLKPHETRKDGNRKDNSTLTDHQQFESFPIYVDLEGDVGNLLRSLLVRAYVNKY
jgi:hypothetical protein